MRTAAVLIAFAALGCSGEKLRHSTPSSPLLAATWPSPFGISDVDGGVSTEQATTEETRSAAKAPPTDLRGKMIAEAERLLSDTTARPERWYGAVDLDEVMQRVSPKIRWDASEGLERLAALARRKNAFRADAAFLPGDIALFHNQIDADADGILDDYFTGAAVILEIDGPKFVAFTRTGSAPRRIVVWPNGPAVPELRGERVNSYIRAPRRSDPKGTEYLAGPLFAGYVDIVALDAASQGD